MASQSSFRIGDKTVGAGHPALIIAEVAMAHDGSLGIAHAHIDAAAAAGADAVKFQTHIAEAESTPFEPFRVKFSPKDATRFDYWKRTEFSETEWKGLSEHAREAGLIFLSSPFSREAADLLARVGVPAWKVASGEIGNLPLLEYLADTGLPVLLSSGMSSYAELDAAVEAVRARSVPVAVFQCTTAYPCPPEKLGLNVLPELASRYECPVGLSDHSGTIYAGLGAVVTGAALLEIHITLSQHMFGPDVPASLTPEEFGSLVRGVRFLETALQHSLDKDAMAEASAPLRSIFGKSVVLTRDLAAGSVLTAEVLAAKKPGNGIPAAQLQEIVGRRLRRDIPANRPVQPEDLE